ncbi:hypothetical protein D7Z54_23470 [Salibacterium salarium]|uniref:DUF2802 domain-containing protein n=1 Tax=Salibacterium salarium TaxID=284579 RepID=A0A428MXP8_9BACI|nr:hypothetical protein [Salibacterium salarium]RSL30928.1 hypothetical protein D7Z54_23470 [Salibacterium salarium]
MEWLIIMLLAGSIIIFALSFLAKDHNKKIDNDMEQLSLHVMGEMYQVKQRLQVLEEELLSVPTPPATSKRPQTQEELANEAYHLFQQNKGIEEIAASMQLKTDEVKYLLAQLN